MIARDDISMVISVMETSLTEYTLNEMTAYRNGSYFIPQKYRIGTSYLELYYFVLTHIVSLMDYGLDYTDYGFTDANIISIVNKSNELIFYYE